MWRRLVATGVALAPAALAAQLADAASRRVLRAADMRLALDALGIAERPLEIERLRGGRSNAVYRIELRRATYVLKQALTGGSVLAFGARLAGPQPYPADLSPAARVRREADALELLAAAGVRAPRLLAADPTARLLLIEHLDGEPLPTVLARRGAMAFDANTNTARGAATVARSLRHGSDARALVAAYARSLHAAHAAGLVLSDAHPGNALVTADGIALIDFEFAERTCDVADPAARRAFDFAYAAQYFTRAERHVLLADVEDRFAVAAQLARLRSFAPLFAYEMTRQRAA